MANSGERIKKIKDYFKELRTTKVDDTIAVYIIVKFPKNWIIADDAEEKFNVAIEQGNEPGEYYFCADIETGEDAAFSAVEYCIEKMKVAIERSNLLDKKIDELEALFADESIPIESLRTLEFTYRGKKKKLPTPTKSGEDNTADKQTETEEQ